jgi:glycine cleavage system H protein
LSTRGRYAHRIINPPLDPIRKYTKDHEWIDLNADKKTGVIGISEYAAEQLGDVVYVELPIEGDSVAAGDAMGAVESVKSASDINAPISCKITQVNILLEEKPGTINQVPEDDSHGGGWIARVEVTDKALEEMDTLMDADAYKAFTSAES